MRRFAAPILASLAIVALAVSAESAPGTGAQVPTLAEHNAVEKRVSDLEARVSALETPTSSPTPTPVPSPTPAPAPATFPTRSSVGPAVDPTVAYGGDCYFDASESGTIIDGKVVDCDAAGGVRFAVDATGIVFRNSIIRGQMYTIGNTPGDPGADQTRAPVFTVEDSKVIQSTTIDWQDRAACCAHYVIRRSLIEGTHSGIGAHNNVELTGNFITTDGSNSHSSGVRVLKNSVLRGNTITCKPVTAGHDGGCSAAGVFYSERLDGTPAAALNLTIDGNYFRRGTTAAGDPGGPWFATRFIDCANRTDCKGIKFTGNQFDLSWGTDGGEFPFYADNEWTNNQWVDGQPALSNTSR